MKEKELLRSQREVGARLETFFYWIDFNEFYRIAAIPRSISGIGSLNPLNAR